MDASRYNSPSRKSRFRSQSGAAFRPVAPAEEPVPEAGVEAETPVYGEEAYTDDAPVEAEAETIDPSTVEVPPEPYEDPVETDPVEVAPEEDYLPAGLRLTRSTEDMYARPKGVSALIVTMISLLCLAVGGLCGYYSRPKTVAGGAPGAASSAERPGPILPLAPAMLADVDAAFNANKQGQFTDARHRFGVLADGHPGWVSMRIEAARSSMYEHDFEGAERMLTTISRAGASADAEFLTGLLQMTTQGYDKSEAAFARAIALDPARADIFYFWGECLRRQGKPQDAADKFRQALLRNQYETTEGLYQLKLWVSEIQADQEAAKDSSTKIDADLASGHPSGPALFAAAAREIKAGRFAEAGARIKEAQKVTEPAVFRVILQDPTYLQENFRPEFAPFYPP